MRLYGEKPRLMWLELKGDTVFVCVGLRTEASSCALALHFAEMDDAVTVFKS